MHAIKKWSAANGAGLNNDHHEWLLLFLHNEDAVTTSAQEDGLRSNMREHMSLFVKARVLH